MKIPERIKLFSDRHPLVGPTLWILSIQYYVAQGLVALAWRSHFSLTQNTISDLGNTVCGLYGERLVCSPGYVWMNISFIVLGLTMVIGSLLMYQAFTKTPTSRIGFCCMALAGLGTILVGVFPEDTIGSMHVLGAALPFILGNSALIILGVALNLPQWLRNTSIIMGMVALLALAFFITQNYLGAGIGGMERIVAYPQSIWMVIVGIYQATRIVFPRKHR